jgi:hypothetical protein
MMNTSRNAFGWCDYPFVAPSTLAIGFFSYGVWVLSGYVVIDRFHPFTQELGFTTEAITA